MAACHGDSRFKHHYYFVMEWWIDKTVLLQWFRHCGSQAHHWENLMMILHEKYCFK
jgi:hypothetical protein